ncbi:MFS transporter [Kitasatospora sp. NA04385]|uniref:MFS transporter n=1 Tax=Kitasatospora sp. NA04385 TaxID=2742135 RepID=UPI001591757B|nr:MFS transporter [Kitasatospora sp. NA04385]QKW20274.1 MFS transporter [Kitasatospora sp. NA04385]
MTADVTTAAPQERPRSLLVRHPDFRRLFTAYSLSQVGTQVSYVAVPLVAIEALGAGAFQVSALAFLGSLPFLLVGLQAGAWLERVRRRPVLVAADLVRGVLMASVPVAWALDALTGAQLYLVVLLVGVATVFFEVASGAYIPHLVGRDNLLEANAKLGGMFAGAEVAGRSIGGFLVQVLTAPYALVVNAVTYLWSGLWLGLIRKQEPRLEKPGTAKPLWPDVRSGITYVFRNAVLRTVSLETSWSNFCLRIVITLVPLLYVSELHRSASLVGAFLTAGGVGVFLGAAVARRIGLRVGYGRALWMVGACCGPFALVVPFAVHGAAVWIGIAAWAVVAFKVGVDNVLKAAIRQHVTADEMMARMGATYRFMITGVLAIGSAVAGLLAGAAGVRVAILVGAVGLAASWLVLFCSPVRGMREMPGVE